MMKRIFTGRDTHNKIPLAPKRILRSATEVGSFLLYTYDKPLHMDREYSEGYDHVELSAYNHPLTATFTQTGKEYSGEICVGEGRYAITHPNQIRPTLNSLKPHMDELLKWDYALRRNDSNPSGRA